MAMGLVDGRGREVTSERTEQRLPVEYMRMLTAFALHSNDLDLGLYCSRCGVNLSGKNASVDNRFLMECACRTFIGANPLGHTGS
jgi:hypothetical protein